MTKESFSYEQFDITKIQTQIDGFEKQLIKKVDSDLRNTVKEHWNEKGVEIVIQPSSSRKQDKLSIGAYNALQRRVYIEYTFWLSEKDDIRCEIDKSRVELYEKLERKFGFLPGCRVHEQALDLEDGNKYCKLAAFLDFSGN